MQTILIKGGRVIDPANNLNKVVDILVEGKKIKRIGTITVKADVIIDAKGLLVVPGLIDMHVHLREPGGEHKETIATGSAAAIAGGFTSVAAMANTQPPIDNGAMVSFVKCRAEEAGLANVFPICAVTKKLKGAELVAMDKMASVGAVAFSDDGKPIMNAEVMRCALEQAKKLGRVIISHCEDENLAAGGIINEGRSSKKLGFKGIPPVAEEIMVARDILLAEYMGGQIHIAHISTKRSVELVRDAKKKGIAVTAEASPHHLTFTEILSETHKMNPPLRTQDDIKALIRGLEDGTIDAIASDHAPHTTEEKEQDISKQPFGVIGLETTLPIILTELVWKKKLPLTTIIKALTVNPACILRIAKGTLSPGADADITIIDPSIKWTIKPENFKSKARNTPFAGREVRGMVVKTIVGGKIFDTN